MQNSVLIFCIVLIIARVPCGSVKYGDVLQIYLDQLPNSFSEPTNSSHPPYIQPSKFPNVSPYIKFADFRISKPLNIPDEISQSLIWRRSTEITCGGFQAHFVVNKTGISALNSTRDKKNNWFGYWHGTNTCKVPAPTCFTKPYQKYNFFGGAEHLGQKNLQILNMRNLIRKFGEEDFPFCIETYILPAEFEQFKLAWARNENKLWIVKPHQGFMSIGVHVIDHWNQIPVDTKLTTVQKYLHSPLLIQGRKFEIRLYVLATSFAPLRAYVYTEGISKISYKNFTSDPAQKSDPCIHIRPLYPDRECPDSIVADFYNNVFLADNSVIFSILRKEGNNVPKLKAEMEDAILKALLSVDHTVGGETRAKHFNRYNGFQIWAFDFIVDTDVKPWLMEVNTIPGMNVDTDDDVRIKFPMIQETLNLVGFHFPPTLTKNAKKLLKSALPNFPASSDPTFDEKMYSFELSPAEKLKQSQFGNHWKYNSSLKWSEPCAEGILDNLNLDDVKQIVIAEDEFSRSKLFKRIFPFPGMRKYLKYVDGNPYYYLLLEAWERRFGRNRSEGIALLKGLTRSGF